jgi:hypothetical protein
MSEFLELTADEITKALPRIMAWRVDPDAAVSCPRCEKAGLTVIDRSARPYAEYYALRCQLCGLEATVHMSLAGPTGQL